MGLTRPVSDITFDPAVGRFRASNGRYVAEATVRKTIDQIADGTAEQMAAVAQRLVDGTATVAEWQADMRRLVKESHGATSIIATGGRKAMTPTDWGHLGQTVRREYRYLNEFAAGLADGTVSLDGRVVSRAKMYGQSSRVTYENVKGRGDRARGYSEEKNVLHASESCASCVAESARGWVTAGELVPVGSRSCKSNCRCTVQRRKAEVAA